MILNACVRDRKMVDENICKNCFDKECSHAGELTTAERLARHSKERTTTMSKLVLTFVGHDSWDRPVYESGDRLYVDTDPRSHRSPKICTKYNNAFDGEPDSPIPEDTEIEFVTTRVVW